MHNPSTVLGLLTLCIVLNSVSATATYSDCDSLLASLFPSLYPHCHSSACKFGQWGDWFYTGESRSDLNCPSGSAGFHNRTRTATGTQCEHSVEYESKYVCKITVHGSLHIYSVICKCCCPCQLSVLLHVFNEMHLKLPPSILELVYNTGINFTLCFALQADPLCRKLPKC